MTITSPVTKRFDSIRLSIVSATSSAVTTRLSGAGVVDQHVEPPQGLLYRIEHRATASLVGAVAFGEQRPRAELFGVARGRARCRLARVVVDRHVVAGASQRQHRAFADAGRSAGDESNFSGRHAGPALRWD